VSPARVTGIVLAGGRSTRFGGDKLAVEIGGRPLLHLAIEAVAGVADEVVVVVGADAPDPALPRDVAVPVLVARDAVAGQGPLAGLAAGLAAASHPLAILVGGDQPWLRSGILHLLVAGLESVPGRPDVDVVALADGASLWPFPVALRAATARPGAETALAGTERRLVGLFGRLRVRSVPETRWRELDPAGDSLRDVDTRGDLPSS
jgi:molybdopterin-guanine dinucleotide biosynthesis protein A